jgi:hypothetical protein
MKYFILLYSLFIIFHTEKVAGKFWMQLCKILCHRFCHYKIGLEELSYVIVKAYSGELKVETKEGEGTTFIIVIPITH